MKTPAIQVLSRLLKWILPTPIRVFEWGTGRVLSALKGVQAEIQRLSAGLQEERLRTAEGLAKLEANSRLDSLEKQHAEIQAELARLMDILNRKIPQKVLYNSGHERRAIQSFHDMREQADYPQKFLDLVSGLEPASVATVVRILQRQQRIKGTEGQEIDLFTAEEQGRIRDMEADFASNVLKVSEGLYCYKNYRLPLNHFEAAVFRDRHGLALVEHPEAVGDKDIIDAGGYIGDSALILAPLTRRNVYVFEAASENFAWLLKTIEWNGLENVVPEKKALGAGKGAISMNISGACSHLDEHQRRGRYQETVDVVALDRYVEEHSLEVGLIKVDIEGFEPEFLKGAEKTIRTQRPILLLSIYHNAHDFFTLKPLIESWGLGYRFRIHKPVDHTVSREVLLIAEVRT